MPAEKGLRPSYEQKTIAQNGKITTLVSTNGEAGSLSINQNMSMYRVKLEEGESITLHALKDFGYLHIVKGSIKVEQDAFFAGDAFATAGQESLRLVANSSAEALWFDLPKKV